MKLCICVASAALCGCGIVGQFDPDYRLITQRTSSGTVRLTKDSERVRKFISAQALRYEEEQRMEWEAVRSHRDMLLDQRDLYPARFEFLDSMAREISVDVPSQSYARMLEGSRALCGRDGVNDFTYVRVRITTGPKAGQEGWACFLSEVSPTFP